MLYELYLSAPYLLLLLPSGGNTGDTCDIPLPQWVLNSDPKIWYVDQNGKVDKEYVALFADNEPILGASLRTPVQVYQDFMSAFKGAMGE